jgi:carbonic anhydrase
MTPTYQQLINRNRDHAAARPAFRPALQPTLPTVIVCCADHRADPAHVFQLKPNEAVVLRNPGGRITPALLQELAVLATIVAVEHLDSNVELLVMHHTDCGMTHLSPQRDAAVLTAMFGTTPSDALHLADPFQAVAADVESLRTNPFLPPTLIIGGLVYDLDTGLVYTVVAPAPLSAVS